MENLSTSLNQSIDNLIKSITDSSEYKICINLKKKMNDNKELIDLIKEVKVLQKKYVKSNYDVSIKQKLDEKEQILDSIPLYVEYNNNLKVVNEKINLIKDELNDYFYKKINM